MHALTDPAYTMPPVPTGGPTPGIRWLRRNVARFTDGPDHARHRGIVTDLLAGVDIAELRGWAAEYTRAIVNRPGPVDVMTEAARVVPVEVLCAVLGLPSVPASSVMVIARAYQPGTDAYVVVCGRPGPPADTARQLAEGLADGDFGPADRPVQVVPVEGPAWTPEELAEFAEELADAEEPADEEPAGEAMADEAMADEAMADEAMADEAVAELVEAFGGAADEITANTIALLVQACDATAGLVGNAVLRATTNRLVEGTNRLVSGTNRLVERTKRLASQTNCLVERANHLVGETNCLVDAVVAETLREDPPVRMTRRQVAGTVVAVDLAGLPFGAGPHECPGRDHAQAIAAGILEAVQGYRLVDPHVEYEPSVALRMPATLRVMPGGG